MIPFNLFLKNLKLILIIGVCLLLLGFYKDWEYQKLENLRNTENIRQSHLEDSLRRAVYIYNNQQMQEYLNSKKDVNRIVKESGVKENRIKEITTTKIIYRDTLRSTIYLPSPCRLDSVPKILKFTDSTNCIVIKGIVTTLKDSLQLTFTSKEYKGASTTIWFWERRQWKFLFIKSRFLGKPQISAKVIDECGESRTITVKKQSDDS